MTTIAKPTCSHEECTRPVWARGMCSTHYSKWYQSTPKPLPKPNQHQSCLTEGCSRPVTYPAKKMCRACYERSRRTHSRSKGRANKAATSAPIVAPAAVSAPRISLLSRIAAAVRAFREAK
jgi:hypothetical protein